ncbi:MAG: glycosyltransferase family 2 protein [Solirubrobacterales bacterium]|nr:glycosyltransferase family 2 protein [Solirubrobacterales bacterium]
MTPPRPRTGELALSVLVVAHGAWELTQRALAALAQHTSVSYELIVVDNGSQDETRRGLREMADARVIINERNRGFAAANNQAARLAGGENLLLLNTDAFVRPDWLAPMLETLALPGVGAVVPRYLHGDGRLQEAGTLLARDGTVQVHGDGDDPEALRYRFRRRVDHGGAACMLIARRTYEALGGFDESFTIAYYEDADLCLRLAERGLSVVYEPRATVTHLRYGSGSPGRAAELSERNRHLFTGRWGRRLVPRPWTLPGAGGQAAIAARDALATPRVLLRCPAPRADTLLGGLLGRLPAGRLTWVPEPLGDGPPVDPWLARGVEVADELDPGWLDHRLFHYDIVVLDGDPEPRFAAAALRTQPQARRVRADELAEGLGSASALTELLAVPVQDPPRPFFDTAAELAA